MCDGGASTPAQVFLPHKGRPVGSASYSVEEACATAMHIGIHEYRFVRRYLERRPHPQMFLRQIDPLIRQLTEYREFINLKARKQPE
jgi:hypothetical protein